MKLLASFRDDPLLASAMAVALFALATTPLAFALLGRMEWFQARRGRVTRRPSFAAVVCGMMLVMAIPAIFLALAIKSRHFDANRYEFDPNKTWSVLEQGRSYRDLKEADEAVRREMERLARVRKELVENVKKLDETMLALRAVAGTSPAVAQRLPDVLQRLAAVRRSVGVDGPQQLMDFTAPPADLASRSAASNPSTPVPASSPNAASSSTPTQSAPTSTAVSGLTRAQVDAELAAVPEPQRALAAMLPLTDLPPGWTVGTSGARHLETFNAENLYEKIDGRAESFLDYNVRGMAYANYQPEGDESNEVQLYIFEMDNSVNSKGKFLSERPEDSEPLAVGAEGYTSAGSLMFYSDRFYTQIVSTQDEPKFSAFALDLARRIAAQQRPAPGGAGSGKGAATPETIFALLPKEPKPANPNYAPRDVFGYSFLSSVFLADYQEGDITWQGFLRPYADPKAARAVFDQYVETAKKDGAEITTIDAEVTDAMVVSSNIGLVDVIFLKGNALGGANGATEAKPAEEFARAFARNLPATVPTLEPRQSAPGDEGSPEGEGP